jgi:hypothetical protein
MRRTRVDNMFPEWRAIKMGALSLVQMSPPQEDDGPAISQRISEEAIDVMAQSRTMYSKESIDSFTILCAVQSTPQLEQCVVWWSTVVAGVCVRVSVCVCARACVCVRAAWWWGGGGQASGRRG